MSRNKRQLRLQRIVMSVIGILIVLSMIISMVRF
jgi:predicted nucleic acid-binding Zn ribbon protein